MNWGDYLVYDETSPSGLRWVASRGNKAKAGDVVGSQLTYGHWMLSLTQNGKERQFLNHRVIWEILNGPIREGLHIDHLDGNPSNNKIENLRVVTNTVNRRNMKQDKRNTTGVTGVKFDRQNNRYVAHWCGLKGEKLQRYFSVKKHGNSEALRLACECRKNAIEELNAQGAGYTERHGVPK